MTSFNTAFAQARKSGKKVFSWNGKSYNTKLASSGSKSKVASKKVPVPTPRPSGTKTMSAKADYPRAPKPVGIASASSPIGKAAAKRDNAPKKAPTVTPSNFAVNRATAYKKATAKPTPKQGPVPEGVWYARKGSAISVAAAKRANAPTKKAKASSSGGGGW